MSSRLQVVRNVTVVAALAAAVWAVPAAGTGADLVSAVLSILFAAGIGFLGVRMYLEHRVAIHGLGDRHRGLLYAAIGVGFVTIAATHRLWNTGSGTIAWLALVAACIYALVEVFRHSRAF
jgi:hypothetical protein